MAWPYNPIASSTATATAIISVRSEPQYQPSATQTGKVPIRMPFSYTSIDAPYRENA